MWVHTNTFRGRKDYGEERDVKLYANCMPVTELSGYYSGETRTLGLNRQRLFNIDISMFYKRASCRIREYL